MRVKFFLLYLMLVCLACASAPKEEVSVRCPTGTFGCGPELSNLELNKKLSSFSGIQTKRLNIRLSSLADAKNIYDILSDPHTVKMNGGGVGLPDVEHPYGFSRLGVLMSLQFTIEKKETGEVIGFVTLVRRSPHFLEAVLLPAEKYDSKSITLGYNFAIKEQNKGYATEAVEQIIDYAFRELDIERIYAVTREDNPASQKVLSKVGFHNIGRHLWPYSDDGYEIFWKIEAKDLILDH